MSQSKEANMDMHMPFEGAVNDEPRSGIYGMGFCLGLP